MKVKGRKNACTIVTSWKKEMRTGKDNMESWGSFKKPTLAGGRLANQGRKQKVIQGNY